MTTKSPAMQPPEADGREQAAVRQRILDAAFDSFTKRGYAATSTLEIATGARVSKRELYTLVGNKQEILMACIGARAERMQAPANLHAAEDRETLAEVLTAFGEQVLREITHPNVVAMFRLAIAEAVHAPEVAQTLDSIGRETIRSALRRIMTRARAAGLVDGRPAELAERFGALLLGNVMVGLLLGIDDAPDARDISARARNATAAFLQLYSFPSGAKAARRSR
jgi:AcrR family transcriptional regulator